MYFWSVSAGYLVSDVVFVLARLASIILSVLTFWYGLSLSETQGLDVASGNFNIPAVRLFALGAVCLLQAYLMFHFITDKLRQLREAAPSVQPRKATAKKAAPKKKKEEGECYLSNYTILFSACSRKGLLFLILFQSCWKWFNQLRYNFMKITSISYFTSSVFY